MSAVPSSGPTSWENDSVVDAPMCRICFITASDDECSQLVSPCRCEGSQKWVHLSCLRRWQRAVQLDGSNHPEDTQREDRHRICNVCKSAFDIPPQDRATMMSDLACIQPEEIAPGLVLVTKATAAESASRGAQLNLVLRAYIETKAAHFREAVYILTDINTGDGTDGSDSVLGVNLTRRLDTPDVTKLEEVSDEDTIQQFQARGVRVCWMNGGPVRPKVVTALTCVKHLPHARCAEFCARHRIRVVISDHVSSQEAVFSGPMPSVLNLAAEEAACAKLAGDSSESMVLAWAGYAQWSRTQLLGELARGSWGWCNGTSQDIHSAIASLSASSSSEGLWFTLRYADRLRWAPENDLSRDFQRHLERAAEHVGETNAPDPHAETLDALVQLFEARRRGTEPRIPGPGPGGRASGNPPGRACTQQ